MSLNDFIAKWNGRYIDFDGAYGAQCMDLMHQWCVEGFGISNGAVLAAPSAKLVYMNFATITGRELFDRIPNTDTNVPEEGDILLWGNGTYGHVAIFIEGDVNGFKSFDQNFPTGSPCHIQNHTYTNLLGWLHFKGTTAQSELDKCNVDKKNYYDFLSTIANILNKPLSRDVIVPELQRLVQLEDTIRQTEKQLEEAKTKVSGLELQLSELNQKHSELIDQNEKLTKKVGEQQTTINEQGVKIVNLDKSIQEIKEQVNKPLYTGWKKRVMDFIDRLP